MHALQPECWRLVQSLASLEAKKSIKSLETSLRMRFIPHLKHHCQSCPHSYGGFCSFSSTYNITTQAFIIWLSDISQVSIVPGKIGIAWPGDTASDAWGNNGQALLVQPFFPLFLCNQNQGQVCTSQPSYTMPVLSFKIDSGSPHPINILKTF